ncbi:MAG: hypothetical protein M3161_04975 [Actinomycetota bacterium]|nr:hypothetical protein [Actinomycetota bacterium]
MGTSYRGDFDRRVRVGLFILAAPTLITGLWAILAPASWYADYGHGIAPPSAFGDYNEHFVQDLGSGYLGIGAVLVAAAMLLQRQVVMTALAGFLVFTLPHFVVHLVEPGELDRSGYVFTTGVLALAVLVALWVWRLNARRRVEDEHGS